MTTQNMRFLLLISIGFIAINLLAQKEKSTIEKVSYELLDIKEYIKDPEAEAVVLYDSGESYFIENERFYSVIFERKTRIKIFTEAGIRHSEVEIPFYREGNIKEKVSDIIAHSYNIENGKITKNSLSISNTYEEIINEHWSILKFAIPNVKAGSVVEYEYKIESTYLFNFRNWYFQKEVPVEVSKYKVRMIPFLEYTLLLQGVSEFDKYTSYEDKEAGPRGYFQNGPYTNKPYYDLVHEYEMYDIGAFKDEAFISSVDDYIIKLDFQLAHIHRKDGQTIDVITTWEKLAKSLLENEYFGKHVKKSEREASKLLDIKSLTQKPEKEKLDYILSYVKTNFTWNGSRGMYASKPLKDLLKDQFGNSSDLNLFTIGLLNAVGLNAEPCILSTRDHGKIKYNYPFARFFNYTAILVYIDGYMVLSDATDIHLQNDRIPLNCINDKALVIEKNNTQWVRLECYFPSTIQNFFQMNISENYIVTDFMERADEYYGNHYRKKYGNNSQLLKQYYENIGFDVVEDNIKVQNFDDLSKPYTIRAKLKSNIEGIGKKIYVTPFLKELPEENPFTQKVRNYPIDMVHPIKRVFNATLSIPAQYTLDYHPENQSIKSELFDLDYSIKVFEDKINLSLEYYFKKTIYGPEEYAEIKSFYDTIVGISNDKIVMVKE